MPIDEYYIVMGSREKILDNERRPQRGGNLWLVLSVFFGLLPIVLDTLKDWGDPIFELLPISDVSSVVLVLALSIIIPIIGAVKVRGWWKTVPILLVILNLVLSFFAYALYQWAESCANGAYQC